MQKEMEIIRLNLAMGDDGKRLGKILLLLGGLHKVQCCKWLTVVSIARITPLLPEELWLKERDIWVIK